jgi:hypothetical protein
MDLVNQGSEESVLYRFAVGDNGGVNTTVEPGDDLETFETTEGSRGTSEERSDSRSENLRI